MIDVKGPANFAARLFVADNGLPIMLSWQQRATGCARAPGCAGCDRCAAGAHGRWHPLRRTRRTAAPVHPLLPVQPAPEQRLFFADYRDVDGLKLPFRIRRAAGAETTEETTFDRYRINAKVDPRRFDTTAK